MLARYEMRLRSQAAGVLVALETRLDRIMQAWLLLAGVGCAARMAVSPSHGPLVAVTIGPYLLLILAPFASMVLALRWFVTGEQLPQPFVRLARIGQWRDVGLDEARQHPLFGASGIMVSLLVGMLMNVPVRAAEYLAAMPTLTGPIPPWLATLNIMMTLDVVVFTSLYTIGFVTALRRVPIFPRLLVGIWTADITMQLVTADIVGRSHDLPTEVSRALGALLDGNVKKVLISAAVWTPYLMLSRRVNVTYRHRI